MCTQHIFKVTPCSGPVDNVLDKQAEFVQILTVSTEGIFMIWTVEMHVEKMMMIRGSN